MEAERAALYATPERVREIEQRQPEATEWGRALFFRPGTPLARERQSRPVVEEVESEIAVPAWRKSFEFEGQEELLGAESETDSADVEEVLVEAVAN
jgi:hypothetical protein